MRIGTIFSGCGAPEQAAKRVWQDHKVVFACEWDKYARQSYLANYKIDEAHFHTDIKIKDVQDGRVKYKGEDWSKDVESTAKALDEKKKSLDEKCIVTGKN